MGPRPPQRSTPNLNRAAHPLRRFSPHCSGMAGPHSLAARWGVLLDCWLQMSGRLPLTPFVGLFLINGTMLDVRFMSPVHAQWVHAMMLASARHLPMQGGPSGAFLCFPTFLVPITASKNF